MVLSITELIEVAKKDGVRIKQNDIAKLAGMTRQNIIYIKNKNNGCINVSPGVYKKLSKEYPKYVVLPKDFNAYTRMMFLLNKLAYGYSNSQMVQKSGKSKPFFERILKIGDSDYLYDRRDLFLNLFDKGLYWPFYVNESFNLQFYSGTSGMMEEGFSLERYSSFTEKMYDDLNEEQKERYCGRNIYINMQLYGIRHYLDLYKLIGKEDNAVKKAIINNEVSYELAKIAYGFPTFIVPLLQE